MDHRLPAMISIGVKVSKRISDEVECLIYQFEDNHQDEVHYEAKAGSKIGPAFFFTSFGNH